MATYLETQQRIATELNRSDLSTPIQSAIKSAIAYYKKRRFWWNETTGSLSCTASQAYVTLPTDFVDLDYLQVTIGSTLNELRRVSYFDIVKWRANSSEGQPTDFDLYQNRIELFRVPDSTYTLTIHYVKELTVLSGDSDENAWLTDGEELIRCHAKRDLYIHNIRNTAAAQDMQAMVDSALFRLESQNTRRTTTGKTRAYYL